MQLQATLQCFSVVFIFSVLTRTAAEHEIGDYIYNQSCPPWKDHGSDCICKELKDHQVKCRGKGVSVNCGTCLTWNNEIEKSVIADCPYFPENNSEICETLTYSIPGNVSSSNLTSFVCSQFNRQGTHCGECMKGYGPAPFLNGANIACAKCHKHNYMWLLYLCLHLFMITILYLFFVFCEVKGTSSPLSVMSYYHQVLVNAVTSNAMLYAQIRCSSLEFGVVGTALTTYAFWNLDFFRFSLPPVCVSSSMSNVQVLLLDYVVAFFPVLLTMMSFSLIMLHGRGVSCIVWLWKPFNALVSRYKKKWNPIQSILSTFATFLLLSYSKILFTSVNLLYGVEVYDNNGKTIKNSPILYYDTSLEYFRRKHVPYACLSLVSIFFFNILPPVILILYTTKCFKRCLQRCGFRSWHTLAFVTDVFQGWYKDGTSGTFDYRAFSALFMVLRLCFASEFILVLMFQYRSRYNSFEWTLPSVIHIGLGCFYLTVKPYKKNWMNAVDGLVMILTGMICCMIIVDDSYTQGLTFLLTTLPTLTALLCILRRLFQRAKSLGCFKLPAPFTGLSALHGKGAPNEKNNRRLMQSDQCGPYSPLQSSLLFSSQSADEWKRFYT